MIGKTKLLVVLVLLFLALAFSAVAQESNLGSDVDCNSDEECDFCLEFEEPKECYCDILLGICFADDDGDTGADDSDDSDDTLDDTSEELTNLTQRVTTLETMIQGLTTRIVGVETSAGTLPYVKKQVSDLNQKVQKLSSDFKTTSNEVDTEINTVSTGLAGLQQDLETTQEDLQVFEEEVEKRNKFLIYTIFIIIFLVVAGETVFYLVRRKQKEVHPKINSYVTSQIRQGKKYPQIKNELLKAGWSEHQIEWAYQHTTRKNYNKYLGRSGGKRVSSGPNTKKIALIVGISLLFVVGMLFLLKGVTTGKTVHFISQGELESSVEEILTSNTENNIFYDEVDAFNLCVQVKDGAKSVSYQVLKTNFGGVLRQVPQQCDGDDSYDFAVKFQNWESFDLLANSLSCQNLLLINQGEKNVVILPSQYVRPGFTSYPDQDYSQFCSALQLCLEQEEVAGLGIGC